MLASILAPNGVHVGHIFGSKKAAKNDDFQHPWMWLKCCKYKQNQWISAFGFSFLLGLILEVFWDPKLKPRPSKSHFRKTSKKWYPKWAQTGPKGSPKWIQNCSKWGLGEVASRPPPGSILKRFWRHFGTIFDPCSECMLGGFCMRLLATGCK